MRNSKKEPSEWASATRALFTGSLPFRRVGFYASCFFKIPSMYSRTPLLQASVTGSDCDISIRILRISYICFYTLKGKGDITIRKKVFNSINWWRGTAGAVELQGFEDLWVQRTQPINSFLFIVTSIADDL